MATQTLPYPAVVNDGYISGYLHARPKACARCGQRTRIICIEETYLPNGMTLRATILQDKAARMHDEEKCIPNIGIGCGCYARFHRQVAIIRTRMSRG